MESEKIGKLPGDPSLSACMIVKDEEEFLPQCLDSIKDVVDELIIVDTGSTDRTVEIAESYGARVYHHPWKGSFSEARNHSIKYATCDWILQIDADEKLEAGDIPALRAALRYKKYNSVLVALVSEMPNGLSMNYFQRIYRRGKAHYEGIVHNQLKCEGEALLADIRIHHYGYNLEPEQMKKKHNRTENLLKKQIAENPDFIFAWSNLVRIYRCQKLWDDAIETAQKALEVDSLDANITAHQMILCDMAYSIFMKKDYDSAIETCARLLELNQDNLDGNFYLGGLYICKKDYQKAIRYYKRYIEISGRDSSKRKYDYLIVDTHGSQAQAWNNMGTCHVELGQNDRGVLAFQKAISYDDKDPMYHENLARSFMRQNLIDKAAEALEKAVNLGIATGPIYHQLSDIYRSREEIERAIAHLRKAIEIDETNVRYYVSLGELLISQGRAEDAEALLNEAAALEPDIPEILNRLAIANARLQKEAESSKCIDRIMELDDISPDQYMNMANGWVSVEEHNIAILFYERCLKSGPDNHAALTNLATCYAKLGEYESAFTGYKAALEMSPNDPTVVKNLLAMKEAINRSIVENATGKM